MNSLSRCAASAGEPPTIKEWHGYLARGLYANGTCDDDQGTIGKMTHTKVQPCDCIRASRLP